MRELCLPLPAFEGDQTAHIQLTIGDRKTSFEFRVEGFPWQAQQNIQERIDQLKLHLANYDRAWELRQIYTPADDARRIHVLFRKKA